MDRSNSLFHKVPICSDPACDGSVFDMDFCKCELIGDNAELMKISCNQNIAQPQPTNDNPPLQPVPRGKINQNGKRGITYTDDDIYFYDDIEPDLPSLPPRKKRSVNVFEVMSELQPKRVLLQKETKFGSEPHNDVRHGATIKR